MPAPAIELFLSPDGRGQSLARGLAARTLAAADVNGGERGDDARPHSHVDPGGDPGSLRDQGWGVIAPAGEDGDRLLALARPLLERRAADQDGEVPVYRVPPAMTAAASAAWIDRKLVDNALLDAVPGYLMVLGRPDQVSFELQQVLAAGFSVGRVGFDAEAGYEAYLDKLLHAERAAARPASAVYFTARDGTPATELGRRLLIQPCLADAEQQRAAGRFAGEVAAVEDDDPARAADRLRAAAAGAGVVFSCSHGAGAPPGGWASPELRRARQGALWLGGDVSLDAAALARGAFAPGGVWLMFACFGAGTPARSAYHHWLARLADAGEHDDDLAPVLASLPADGEPAFLAALPQAALANPDGPLAVIGHLDLAWSYGFCDLDKMSRGERHRRFHDLMAQLVKGTRVGLALGGSLMRARNQVQTEIAIAADDAQATAVEPAVRLGHRWMVMQDLAGYIALGDPAARLAVAAAARAVAAPDRAAPELRTAPAEGGRDERAASKLDPAAGPRSDAVALDAGHGPGPAAAAIGGDAGLELDPAAAGPRLDAVALDVRHGPGPAAAAGGGIAGPGLDAAAIEALVHDLIAERATAAELAARHAVAESTVEDWRRAYTDAGRRAIASLLAGAGASTRSP